MICTLSHSMPVSPFVCPVVQGEASSQDPTGPGGEDKLQEEEEEEVVDA